MLTILKQIAVTGIKTEAMPPGADENVVVARLQEEVLRTLGRALTIRQVDAGSCNGCELEIHALANPYYNIEGVGIRFVASPRHADMLLVTGPVSKHMAIAVKRTYDATPDPKLVVAVGECHMSRTQARANSGAGTHIARTPVESVTPHGGAARSVQRRPLQRAAQARGADRFGCLRTGRHATRRRAPAG